MSAKRVKAAEGVILAALVGGDSSAAGIAAALEAACLLQSPESAAEARQLQDDITGACLARYEEEQENARLLEERHSTNEALSDAAEALRVQRDRIAELEAAAEKVAGFCAARAEYVDNINHCAPSNDRDYWRWNGHAEARRQLSQLLGLPVVWPAEDLPTVPRQVTGRCPRCSGTFEDCTCGGGR